MSWLVHTSPFPAIQPRDWAILLPVALPCIIQTFWLSCPFAFYPLGLLATQVPFSSSPLTCHLLQPGSGSRSLRTFPDASGYTLPHISNKFSPPPYLGASIPFFYLFSSFRFHSTCTFPEKHLTIVNQFLNVVTCQTSYSEG